MHLELDFANRQRKYPVTDELRALLRQAAEETLMYEQFAWDAELSVTFVSNEGIRRLNRDYRGKNTATDVLSFPLCDGDFTPEPGRSSVALGDIVLSLERAASQAEEYGHSLNHEAAFLTIHSVLHLLGYDHMLSEEADEDMCRRQREIMARLPLRDH